MSRVGPPGISRHVTTQQISAEPVIRLGAALWPIFCVSGSIALIDRSVRERCATRGLDR
jgi:hypothetical protein